MVLKMEILKPVMIYVIAYYALKQFHLSVLNKLTLMKETQVNLILTLTF